ncbi:hypothetical protein PInf_024778 [Phytophthora infestans]|nr:hypothetical protein PInf_024778 [Phytophthora infestans]
MLDRILADMEYLAVEPTYSRLGQPKDTGTATASNRDPSTSPHGGAPPSAPSSLELQVASIPQSYIGREYRAYIVSTGSAMPQYLQ